MDSETDGPECRRRNAERRWQGTLPRRTGPGTRASCRFSLRRSRFDESSDDGVHMQTRGVEHWNTTDGFVRKQQRQLRAAEHDPVDAFVAMKASRKIVDALPRVIAKDAVQQFR